MQTLKTNEMDEVSGGLIVAIGDNPLFDLTLQFAPKNAVLNLIAGLLGPNGLLTRLLGGLL